MSKLVVFEIGEGDFQRGFRVNLKIGEEGKPHSVEISTTLPPAPEIPERYHDWQSTYRRLEKIWRIILPPIQVTNVSSRDECSQAANALVVSLNQWLNQESVQKELQWKLLPTVKKSEEVHFIIKTQNSLIRRLPLHLWDFFQSCYPHAEIAICSEYEPSLQHLKYKVKILALLGHNQGLDIQKDLDSLVKLPVTKVELLQEPSRKEFTNKLWNKSWDILFFAGHSFSTDGDNQGQIQINQNESLSLDTFRNSLKNAVRKGLKLAFFNSCDGLGLAKSLADLKIPYIIVMREPVPDTVAQHFLEYFLTAFSNGETFYLSVKQARERLQEELESEYPCASWLPVIFQNPAASSLKWPKQQNWRQFLLLAIGGVITTIGVYAIGSHWWEEFQFWNRTSYGEKILIPSVNNQDKELGVEAFLHQDYGRAFLKFQNALQQLPNDPETLIYLNNAEIGNRSNFAVAVSVPISSNKNVAQEILRGVAQAQHEINHQSRMQGKFLKIKIIDDANDITITRKIADKLVEDSDIIAVIGHNASDASVVAAPIYEKGKLVMMSSTSFSQKLTGMGSYIFRTAPNITYIGESLSKYIIEKTNHTKLTICVEKTAEDNKSFKEQFQSGIYRYGQKVEIIDINCDFSNFKFNPHQIIDEAIKNHVDGFVLAPHIDKLNKALELVKANKGRLPLFASPTLYTFQTLEGKADVNGIIVVVPWHPLAFPHNPFSKNAQKLWGGNVGWRTATSYDATIALIAGLQTSNNRQELQQALSNNSFSANGAIGKIGFQSSGHSKYNSQPILLKIQPSRASITGYDFFLLQNSQSVNSVDRKRLAPPAISSQKP